MTEHDADMIMADLFDPDLYAGDLNLQALERHFYEWGRERDGELKRRLIADVAYGKDKDRYWEIVTPLLEM